MKLRHTYILVLLLHTLPMLCSGKEPEIIAVKAFSGWFSLSIPLNGCVEVDGNLTQESAEHWLSLDHLTADTDFGSIQILVNSDGTILGARATFKGSLEDWRGVRGYESRKRVLFGFLGGDGPELSRDLPLVFHSDAIAGYMVYTFDREGHATWRKSADAELETEEAYVKRQEAHKAECDRDECKNLSTTAGIVLQKQKKSNKSEMATPRKPSD